MAAIDLHSSFNFQSKVEKAKREAKRILDTERHPVLAGDAHHAYQDKYCLAEWLTNTALAATLNCLEVIGLDGEKLAVLVEWAKAGHAVWLEANEGLRTCKFLRMEERDEASKTKVVSESELFGKSTCQIVTTIKEHFFEITVEYKIVARCNGKDPQFGIICARRAKTEIKTTSEVAPMEETIPMPLTNLKPDITFLLKELANGGSLSFSINRNDKCHTPVRNNEVEKSLKFFGELRSFANDHQWPL